MPQEVLANKREAYNKGMTKPIFQVLSQNPKLPISKIEYNGLKLEFIKPYIMTVKIDGKYLVHENMKLNMVIAEKSLDELIESFFDYFAFLWQGIVLEKEVKLHSSAEKLKEYLMSLAKEY